MNAATWKAKAKALRTEVKMLRANAALLYCGYCGADGLHRDEARRHMMTCPHRPEQRLAKLLRRAQSWLAQDGELYADIEAALSLAAGASRPTVPDYANNAAVPSLADGGERRRDGGQ